MNRAHATLSVSFMLLFLSGCTNPSGTVLGLNKSWTQVNNGLASTNVISLATNGRYVFAGTEIGAFRSTDDGDNWVAINTNLPRTFIRAFAFNSASTFAGTDSGVFTSTDAGNSWVPLNDSLTELGINRLAFIAPYLFAGTINGIFRTTPPAFIWNRCNTDFGQGWSTFALGGKDKSVYASSWSAVFRSTNSGDTWSRIDSGFPNGYFIVTGFVFNGLNIYASEYASGVYLSTNHGSSWIPPTNDTLTYRNVNDLASNDSYIFAATGRGVYLCSPGTPWTNIGLSSPDESVYRLALSNKYIFAATMYVGSGIWRQPL
jgi:photosystem II stability/assembly factor-like uncharacterized protein